MQKQKDSVLSNLTEPITQGLRNRFGDPFISTISITFLVWNFQIFLFLFSDFSPWDKYNAIIESIHWYSILGSVLLSLFILLALPKVFTWGYRVLETNRADLKNIEYSAGERLRPIEIRFKELESQKEAEIQKNNLLTEKISEKDQEIGQEKERNKTLLKRISDLELALKNINNASKSNPKPPEPVLRPPKKEKDIFQQILENQNMDTALLLPVREYAESKNLTPDAAVKTYDDAAISLVENVVNNNSQSISIKQNFTLFLRAMKENRRDNATSYCTNMEKKDGLRSEETAQLHLAQNLLQKVSKYLA